MLQLARARQDGFTLIEMLVIAPIVILAIGAFLTVIISMTGEVLASRSSNALAYNVQDAINRIDQDVKLSSGFLAQNNITLTAGEAQGYNNDATNFTNVGGTSGTSLILNMLATDGNPLSSSSSLVYLADKPNACSSSQLKDNTPMTVNVVYFVKDSTLWRRTIMPSNYASTSAYCSTPWQRPSCAPNYTASFCKTNDIKLVEGVSSSGFFLEYLGSASSTTGNTVASDPTATVSARNTALYSVPTVSVSVLASTSTAGRTIERSASLRSTRLETNASTIAVVTPDTTPTAPTVTSTTTAPANAVFSWNAVSGATGYTVEYNINGGAWQTGFTNQNTRTYTVGAPYNGAVVNARVVAINSAGTSGYGSSSVTIPIWVPLLLGNNWVWYGSVFAVPAYTKTSSGLVVLKGLVKAGASNIATLPEGYRPATNEWLMFENSSNQAVGRLDITDAGVLGFSVGNNAWYSLDGIAFMPSGAMTFTNFSSFLNSWQNFTPGSGDLRWALASYGTDSLGRVHTRGLVRSGTVADGTDIVTLPAGSRPAEYAHFVNVNSNAAGLVGIQSTGPIEAKGGGNSYLGMNTMFYPSGRATGATCTTQWCNLTLQNSWVHYGSPQSVPQYTKSADGVVVLKGLVRSGATSQVMATLPANYCPKEQLLLTVATAVGWGRVDITSGAAGTGCTITNVGGVVSTTWTSFDAIKFIAEV
jgi:type II secretory pathway pseudopilin PulG